MRDWLSKLLVSLQYRLARFFAIDPPFRIDQNAYCPTCGHRKGKIRVVVLERPDQGKSKLAILHTCEVDKYEWIEPSATVVEHHILGEPQRDPEREAIETLVNDPKTRNIRGRKRVNGELVS